MEIEEFLGNQFGTSWEWLNYEANIHDGESRCFKYGVQATLTPIADGEWQLNLNSKLAFGTLKDPRLAIDLTPYLRRIVYLGAMIPFEDQEIDPKSFLGTHLIARNQFESQVSRSELIENLSSVSFEDFMALISQDEEEYWKVNNNFWGTKLTLSKKDQIGYEICVGDLSMVDTDAIDISGYFTSVIRKFNFERS